MFADQQEIEVLTEPKKMHGLRKLKKLLEALVQTIREAQPWGAHFLTAEVLSFPMSQGMVLQASAAANTSILREIFRVFAMIA